LRPIVRLLSLNPAWHHIPLSSPRYTNGLSRIPRPAPSRAAAEPSYTAFVANGRPPRLADFPIPTGSLPTALGCRSGNATPQFQPCDVAVACERNIPRSRGSTVAVSYATRIGFRVQRSRNGCTPWPSRHNDEQACVNFSTLITTLLRTGSPRCFIHRPTFFPSFWGQLSGGACSSAHCEVCLGCNCGDLVLGRRGFFWPRAAACTRACTEKSCRDPSFTLTL